MKEYFPNSNLSCDVCVRKVHFFTFVAINKHFSKDLKIFCILSLTATFYFLFSFILYADGGLLGFKTFQKTFVKMLWVFQQEMV